MSHNSDAPNPQTNKMTDRLDATTRAAEEIISKQRAAEDIKTAKLRAARLAKEAADIEDQ